MSDTPSKLLIIQLKRAGDILVTTPVLSALKASFPQASIDFLVDRASAPLLTYNPYLRTVLLYDRKSPWKTWRTLREAKYDIIFDFQSSPRSIHCGLFSGAKIHAGYRVTFWGHFLSHAIKRPGQGLSVTEGKMNLVRSILPNVEKAGERRIYLTQEEKVWAAGVLGLEAGTRGIAGLVPISRIATRKWKARSFVELARMCSDKKMPVWWFWGPGEEEEVLSIAKQVPNSRMIPKTTLREMAALIEYCRFLVAADSGPMHLAEAVGTPTITFYGPTDPKSWNQGGPKDFAISVPGLTCLACDMSICPFGHECMEQLSPQMVWKVAEPLWS